MGAAIDEITQQHLMTLNTSSQQSTTFASLRRLKVPGSRSKLLPPVDETPPTTVVSVKKTQRDEFRKDIEIDDANFSSRVDYTRFTDPRAGSETIICKLLLY